MVIIVLILFAFGCISVEKNPNRPIGMRALGGVIFILIGWIIQSGTEEIVTRGWLMNILAARYNKVFALILSSTIFGFEVSGINVEVSSIVDFNLVGNKIISGGSFGPEAGLVATFVLLSSIVIVFILDNKGYFTKNVNE